MQSVTLMGNRELYNIRKAQALYDQQFAPNHKHLDKRFSQPWKKRSPKKPKNPSKEQGSCSTYVLDSA